MDIKENHEIYEKPKCVWPAFFLRLPPLASGLICTFVIIALGLVFFLSVHYLATLPSLGRWISDNRRLLADIVGALVVTTTMAIILTYLLGLVRRVHNYADTLERTLDTYRDEVASALENERKKVFMLENLPGMAYQCLCDREWTMLEVSRGCLTLTGYSPENFLNNNAISYNDIILPKYRESLWDSWAQAIGDKQMFVGEYEIITADGTRKWVYEQGYGIFDDDGGLRALEGIIIDINERKKHELRLQHMMLHDMVTELGNKSLFEVVFNENLPSDTGIPSALLLVHMRKFNLVNLTHGYQFGDKLRRDIAERLMYLCTGKIQLFQIAADKFGFYLIGYESSESLCNFCESIRMMLQGLPSNSECGCIGIVEIDNFCCDADTTLKYASIAAEHTDTCPALEYCFFTSEMEVAVKRKESLKNALAAAAKDEDDGLFLVFQPIVEVSTDKIIAFEALARFQSAELGLVPPVEFIPIAEETQLIIPLGKKITRLAFEFLKRLEAAEFNEIIICINVSYLQLLSGDFSTDFIAMIQEMEISPFKLNIEITESVFSDDYELINETLKKLRALGIRVSIDDFGIGYSSFARERELNVDCLKIDRYFTNKLLECSKDESIMADIISMAHKLGHCVVAEGVEFQAQKQYLAENSCDYIQGFLISRPLPEDGALALLTGAGGPCIVQDEPAV